MKHVLWGQATARNDKQRLATVLDFGLNNQIMLTDDAPRDLCAILTIANSHIPGEDKNVLNF